MFEKTFAIARGRRPPAIRDFDDRSSWRARVDDARAAPWKNKWCPEQDYGDSLAGARALPDAEYVAEIYFSLHFLEWVEMRPNFQIVDNPGGFKNVQDVGVLGLKAGVTL